MTKLFLPLLLLLVALGGCDRPLPVKFAEAQPACLDGWQHRVFETAYNYQIPVLRIGKDGKPVPCTEK